MHHGWLRRQNDKVAGPLALLDQMIYSEVGMFTPSWFIREQVQSELFRVQNLAFKLSIWADFKSWAL